MSLCLALMLGAIAVDTQLPAGNIVLDKIEGDRVYVHQDLRDTQGEWFYWAMRVTGAEGRTLTFAFTASDAVGVRGPVVSRDRGRSYVYPAEAGSTRRGFTYTFGADERETWFYECLPYMPADWESFLTQHESQRGTVFVTDALCRSQKGAEVPRAMFGRQDAPHRVFLTSRHHCSESVATYALEGLAAAFLGKDELGTWLRENVCLVTVPFVDYDGVVAGDQGKNRRPHDHNRDYGAFVHSETKAIAAFLQDWKPDVWFDLHCPWLYGGCNERLYTPMKDPKSRYLRPAEEKRFSDILERVQSGSMRYRASDDLPFGKDWNTGGNYRQGSSSINWALENLPSLRLCRTFEIPFQNARGAVVTQEAVRCFGRDLAKALAEYFCPPSFPACIRTSR